MTIGHCILCLRHNIRTSCDFQTTDSGENINFDVKTQGKMGENHQNPRENDVENSVRTLFWQFSLVVLRECFPQTFLWKISYRTTRRYDSHLRTVQKRSTEASYIESPNNVTPMQLAIENKILTSSENKIRPAVIFSSILSQYFCKLDLWKGLICHL